MRNIVLTILFGIMLPLTLRGANTGTHQWADNSVLSQGKWVKVALSSPHDGIYQITYSQLRSWGFKDPSQVGVYGYGGHTLTESLATPHTDDVPEVAVWHDQQRQRILFYGKGMTEWTYDKKNGLYTQRQHPYATQACYFLHQKTEGEPLTISAREASTLKAETVIDTYDEYWLHEVETANLGQTGREWFGESFLTTQVQTFTLPEENHLKGHVMLDGTVRCDVGFVTKGGATSRISVRIDGEDAAQATIPATTSNYGFGTAATATSKDGNANAIDGTKVRISYHPDNSSPSVARLNYIRMQGKCRLEASAQEPFMLFRSAETIGKTVQYRLEGMTADMQIWDVSGVTEMVNGNDDGIPANTGTFMADEKELHEYAVVNMASTAFPGVNRVADVANQNLHALQPVNLVIVTAPAYYRQAQQLAEYRLTHDSLTYVIVTPEQIYNEYSSGVPDATAIRLFVKQLYDRNATSGNTAGSEQLRYLLLFGDGSYDNRMAGRSNNHLLTYQSENSLVETSSCVCDDYFGFLDDDEGGKTDSNGRYTLSTDVLDIGVGRLTASSATEATNLVAKIKSYDSAGQRGSWKNRLCFISDDDKMESSGTDSPNLHMLHNEQLIRSMMNAGHLDYVYKKIYLPAYQQVITASGSDYPDARKELNNALQQGVLLLNYAGHGAANQITNEQIMNTALAGELRMKHLPVWITASCDVSRYDANETSLGETLLLNPNGGAAAMISTARVVYAQQNLRLNQAIIDHIFDRNADGTRFRLGDIMRAAKNQLTGDYNKLNFCLLGDPTMTLAYPEQEVVVDEVKGSFETLSTVTIKGHVAQTGSQQCDTLFHGLIYSTIFDSEEILTADKGLHQDPVMSFATRNRKIFTGRDLITDGTFEFSFIVPEDISDNGGNGLVNLYACSEDGAEAQGYYSDFKITTGAEPTVADTIAPEILFCFLDDASFADGGKVGRTPFFYAEMTDKSGISASGNSIGHDISLYIHSITNPLLANRQIVLNDYFTTFTGEPGHGNVKCSLPELEEGTYEATFRVWDVCNNASSRTFTFTVTDSNTPRIALMQAYPSPARQGETVTFRVLHNRPETADQLRVQIFTQTGVKVFDRTMSSSGSEVVYLQDGATNASQINHALNADETEEIYGATTMTWNATVAPGVYVYKAFLTCGGSEYTAKSKLLMVLGQ